MAGNTFGWSLPWNKALFRHGSQKVDDLTADQRRELEEELAGRPPRAAVTTVMEANRKDERALSPLWSRGVHRLWHGR
jgi:hypothetical protein